eukprot:CAMPEP_0176460670 /NCGR_PEP_ID=MMETSP0127-20121128/34125_1 /TAXON_ID=938130 /ORGANISM="Platyophrya macrostoma, Strain WH" /LENGTH=60 /DNA_ID=CAMNT_0017852071 /DNA_START=1 /DNA_END=180 /DNA_ORIENTATION=+
MSSRNTQHHIIAAANQVGLPLEEFDFRMKSLEESKDISVRRFQPSFLIRCGGTDPNHIDS